MRTKTLAGQRHTVAWPAGSQGWCARGPRIKTQGSHHIIAHPISCQMGFSGSGLGLMNVWWRKTSINQYIWCDVISFFEYYQFMEVFPSSTFLKKVKIDRNKTNNDLFLSYISHSSNLEQSRTVSSNLGSSAAKFANPGSAPACWAVESTEAQY